MKTHIKNKSKIRVAAVFLICFMTGFALASSMYGSLLPDIIDHYSLPLTQASLFDMTAEIGSVCAMLLAMFVLDRLDKNIMIAAMMLTYSATMLLTGAVPPLTILILTKLFMGISGVVVDELCATYMSDLYGDKRSRMISILHTFFAVGSMFGPQVAAMALKNGGGFGGAYRGVGLVCTALVAVFILLMTVLGRPTPAVSNIDYTGKRKKIPFREILQNRNMRWLCLGGALLAGITYINTWAPTYLQTTHPDRFDAAFCSTVLTAAYVGMVVSRVLYGTLSPRFTAGQYMRLSCLLTAADILLMLSFPQRWIWLVGMFLFGVFSGAQYTAKFVMAVSEYAEFSSTAASVAAVFASLGNMLLKLTVNSIADAGHYTAAMLLPVAMLLLAWAVFRFGYGDPCQK